MIAVDLESVPVALVQFDAGGTVVSANQAAIAILGRRARAGARVQDLGWVITDAAGWLDADATDPVLAAIGTGEPQRGVIARLANEEAAGDVWLLVDAAPVHFGSPSDRQILTSISDVTALMNDVRVQKRTDREAALELVSERIAAAELEPQAILEAAVRALSRLRPATWIASLVTKDPGELQVHASSITDPQIADYVRSMASTSGHSMSETSRVLETGEAVFRPSTPLAEFMASLRPETQEYLCENPMPATLPVSNVGAVVVPMHARGTVIGALGVFERDPPSPLTVDDLAWLQEVGDRVGLAVDNASLYVDATSRLDRLTALRNVQLAISQSQDLRLTLGVLLDQAVQGLGVDAAAILLLDSTEQRLGMAASKGFRSTSLPDYSVPVEEGMPPVDPGRRITTVTGLGAFSQFRHRALFAREGFKTYGAVPLMLGPKLAGVLEVFHRSSLHVDREWSEFLDAIAANAALAIERFAGRQPAAKLESGPESPSPAWGDVDKQILGYVVEGLSNAAIGGKVHLSPHTIKFHVGQMLERARVRNRTELARRATKEHWV